MDNKMDIILWRVGLREVYSLDMISQEEFLNMYDRGFIYKDYLTEKEADITKFIIDLIANVDAFQGFVNEEMPFIFGGKLPENKYYFRKHWLYHLAECLEEGNIDEEDFSNLSDSIDFTNPEWTEGESMKVMTILDMLRITMLVKVPASIDFFENPSFEVLMFINDMGVEDD